MFFSNVDYCQITIHLYILYWLDHNDNTQEENDE